ncbi:hypothetical protein QWJ07_22255 [Frankia sp. RB7]|nr:hypothetical protein [Frankia sp. RB7]
MTASWNISAKWEALDAGPPEERAGFGELSIKAHGINFTEGHDAIANRLRDGPLVSVYHFAEWVAWNWWRLRWEPRSKANDWQFAHKISTIGGGYIWPDLTLFSDGERIALISKATRERPQTPYRFLTDSAAVLTATEFQSEIDRFVDEVLQRLDLQKVGESNLQKVWAGILSERGSPELAQKRKLEALLGFEPDEGNDATITQLLQDAKSLSSAAVDEVAAEHGQSGKVLTAAALSTIASEKGFDMSPRNVIRLSAGHVARTGGLYPAWRVGSDAAKQLREQERLGAEPISNKKLADMAGISVDALENLQKTDPSISFALDTSLTAGKVVLRSKWNTGRRFELARLIGDRIANSAQSKLFPATRSYTYRQKLQRSFAAELLSPFDDVEDVLRGDYSPEKLQEAAALFDVSELTIRTSLVNHGRIERDDLEEGLERPALSAANF